MNCLNASALRGTRRVKPNGGRPTFDELAALMPRPNPKLVALVSWAVNAVARKVYDKEYGPWLKWAATWTAGERDPKNCVEIGRWCFSHRTGPGDGVWPSYHALGQIAWAAKEACYSTPQSGWLVVRYIGDAMIAYGIAFPESLSLMPPSIPSNVGRQPPEARAGDPQGEADPE